MPFILSDSWNVDENVISGSVAEVEWSLDDQMDDLRWQQYSRWHVSFSAVWSHPDESQKTFDDENAAWDDEPSVEVWAVKNDQDEERNVHQVSPVEDFKASATTNERKRADKHDHENGDEKETGRVGPATNETEKTGTRSEEEFNESEVLSVDNGIVNDEETWKVIENLNKIRKQFEDSHWSWSNASTCATIRRRQSTIR